MLYMFLWCSKIFRQVLVVVGCFEKHAFDDCPVDPESFLRVVDQETSQLVLGGWKFPAYHGL